MGTCVWGSLCKPMQASSQSSFKRVQHASALCLHKTLDTKPRPCCTQVMQVAPDTEVELPKSSSPNPHNQILATKSPPTSPQVGVLTPPANPRARDLLQAPSAQGQHPSGLHAVQQVGSKVGSTLSLSPSRAGNPMSLMLMSRKCACSLRRSSVTATWVLNGGTSWAAGICSV